MKERPIIFSGPMVRAILEGRKTQTRRGLNPQPLDVLKKPVKGEIPTWIVLTERDPNHGKRVRCRFGVPGDRLWVRETWQDYCPIWSGYWCGCGSVQMRSATHGVYYKADNSIWRGNGAMLELGAPKRYKPSIFMPRWASRVTLEVKAVRVERLQEISNNDALAEGVLPKCRAEHLTHDAACAIEEYERLWDKRGYGWQSNPWVWVIEFTLARTN